MDDLLVRIAENSIVLSIMAFAWKLAETRANAERERVKELNENYIEFLKEVARRDK